MHSTRQAILSAKGVESKLAHIQTDFVLRRRDMRGLETVSGIELTTVVSDTGAIVRAAPTDPTKVLFASERTELGLENSALYRDLLTSNKVDPKTKELVNERKKVKAAARQATMVARHAAALAAQPPAITVMVTQATTLTWM